MSFDDLANRVDDLPLVLAGPIVRRTRADLVTIWLALSRQASNLRLEVYDASSTVAGGQLAATTALGNRLHIAVIDAQPVSPLVAGTVYEYNVFFASEGGKDLDGVGILSAPSSGTGAVTSISYGNRGRPSFVLPGAAAGDLRFAHGSCRKPHGGKIDAFNALDSVLNATHDNPADRPQQLFLTGDQIYADDVADALLYMLRDAAKSILGWPEPEQLPGNPPVTELMPGHRLELVQRNKGLSSGHAKSHLMRLGEYYCMYLFVWSEGLWPAALPSFEEVLPGQDRESLPATPEISRKSPAYTEFVKETEELEIFKASLAAVRRVLANIATYMMFDDHEVTDDWFATLQWCEDALTKNALSRRIVQNALSAFAVFQAWGNTPALFKVEPAKGAALVKKLALLHEQGGGEPSTWEEIAVAVLPNFGPAGTGAKKLDGVFPWHFAIDFPAHQVIVLDTRTHRSFVSRHAAPNLINADHIDQQLPATAAPKPVTIVISPAPIFGHPTMEEFIQPYARTLAGATTADFEAWAFNPPGFESLLLRLVDYQHVVILSGDVHYGFSGVVDYWDERGAAPRQARFVQLCSSALRNASPPDMLDLALRLDLKLDRLGWLGTEPEAQLKKRGPGSTGFPLTKAHNQSQPAIENVEPSTCWILPPKWRYTITFGRDDRTLAARGIAAVPEGASDAFKHVYAMTWDKKRVVVNVGNLGLVNIRARSSAAGAPLNVEHEFWYFPDELAASASEWGIDIGTPGPRPSTVHTLALTALSAAMPPGVRCL